MPELPVARVVLDGPLPHLDREFEYAVPPELADVAVPGVRIRARFAGKDTAGFVVARAEKAEHTGKLTPLRTVVSDEAVLTPHILRVARQIAGHYAGTLSDVLRLAIPPRHARAEKALTAGAPPPVPPLAATVWQRYEAGPAFLDHLGSGGAPAAVWTAGPDWPDGIAQAAHVALSAGRGW
ncbi:hypothetical protein [Branchiibius cervicis]|uniref:Primosomal protein N' 3' DNA-binding domain-containing protein n=1 Tax=Branchiibius cervicis TaxID=908252 RepID=A0ABW2ASM0_9MICO